MNTFSQDIKKKILYKVNLLLHKKNLAGSEIGSLLKVWRGGCRHISFGGERGGLVYFNVREWGKLVSILFGMGVRVGFFKNKKTLKKTGYDADLTF